MKGFVLIKRACILISLFLPILLAIPCVARAQESESLFKFGFEQQIRNYNWNNAFDFNEAMDDKHVDVRYRTRLWGQAALGRNIDLFAGLVQETKQVFEPETPCHFDEIAFENLFLDFKKLPVNGFSLRIGRQNISRGEGFILHKGTGGEGSRTMYFNAFNLTYARKKSKLEIIGMLQPHMDRLLPVINDRSRVLIEWDEQALGAYYTDKNFKTTSFQAYYFYKKEFHDRRPVSNVQFQPDRHIHTLGGRITQQMGKGLEADGELAAQWGAQQPSIPVKGLAGYVYLKKTWSQRWSPSFSFGYFGLSGDDAKTGDKIEGWDPLFSRWSRWSGSELYLLILQKEKGNAYWTNVGMWRAEAYFAPLKMLTTRLMYYHMNAFHPFRGNPELFGIGTTRGNMVVSRTEVQMNRNLKSIFIYERFAPGDFYASHTPARLIFMSLVFNIGSKFPS
jgi:hypothetical protein